MRHILILLVTLATGCSADAGSIKLTDIDLRDMETVQEINARLPVEQRAIFASYVVRHNAQSVEFCGRALVHQDGTPPTTIGEAIELSARRDAELRRTLAEGTRTSDPHELALRKWEDLISERDLLIEAQSQLREQHGAAAERLGEWKSIEKTELGIDERLTELKPSVFGAERRA